MLRFPPKSTLPTFALLIYTALVLLVTCVDGALTVVVVVLVRVPLMPVKLPSASWARPVVSVPRQISPEPPVAVIVVPETVNVRVAVPVSVQFDVLLVIVNVLPLTDPVQAAPLTSVPVTAVPVWVKVIPQSKGPSVYDRVESLASVPVVVKLPVHVPVTSVVVVVLVSVPLKPVKLLSTSSAKPVTSGPRQLSPEAPVAVIVVPETLNVTVAVPVSVQFAVLSMSVNVLPLTDPVKASPFGSVPVTAVPDWVMVIFQSKGPSVYDWVESLASVPVRITLPVHVPVTSVVTVGVSSAIDVAVVSPAGPALPTDAVVEPES